MERHYNAFISYRHHPEDIRVAAQIHHSLEHLHIPRSLRKNNKGPFRLFRDKEELPASSNLSDDISAALKNSDYLIVICSVHTKESVWVQREIEMFLQTHDRNKVLTVLVNGEPYDVIPEILLHDEKTDPVTGEVTTVDREPLSCDWRLSRRQAKNEELPRLAAALLGCAYDELRQRRRQYRTRRMIAAFSVALVALLCLSAYFLYTTLTIREAHARVQEANVRIQQSLNEALKNQSMHLATAAAERLTEGDRLTAVALAIAALPSDDNERPYVPEAERVLADALGVYMADEDIKAVGAMDISASAVVTQFWLSDSGNIGYTYDRRGVLTGWDTVTMQPLGSVELDDVTVDTATITAEENIVFVSAQYGEGAVCYSPQGALLWQVKDIGDIAIMSDAKMLVVITGDHRIRFLSTADGSDVREALTPIWPEDLSYSPDFAADVIRLGQPIIMDDYIGYDQTRLMAVDPANGNVTVLTDTAKSVYTAYQTDDGKLITMSTDGTGMYTGSIMDMYWIEKTGYDIICYDTVNGDVLWTNKLSTYIYTGFQSLTQIPQSDRLLCQNGNTLTVLDLHTGGVLGHCETGSGIIAVRADETSAWAILQDGRYGIYDYGGVCYEKRITQSELDHACIGKGAIYTLPPYSTCLTVYRNMKGDPLWTADVDSYLYIKDVYGDLSVTYDYTNVGVFDIANQTMRWQTEHSGDILGFTSDGTELWTMEGFDDAVAVFDVATGTFTSVPLPFDAAEGTYPRFAGEVFMANDRLYYTVAVGNTLHLMSWLPKESSATTLFTLDLTTVGDFEWYGADVVAYYSDICYIKMNNGVLLEVNVASGAVRMITEEVTENLTFAYSQDQNRIALAVGNEILVGAPGSEPSYRITAADGVPGALYFLGEELLVICDDGSLYRYDANGALQSQTQLQVYDTFATSLFDGTVRWQTTDDNKLIVDVCGIGNIIERDGWKVSAEIPEFVTYRANDNTLICAKGNTVSAFPRYDIEDLLNIAAEQLGKFKLTDKQLIAYGLQ